VTINSYRDLLVWQAGIELAAACYAATKDFPREELYGMVSQMRRSSASVAANIAEGHGRDSKGQFIQFLRIAQGSVKELETHVIIARRVDLIGAERSEDLLGRCDEIGRMLRSLIRSLEPTS
jgi:four helix bundle protein